MQSVTASTPPARANGLQSTRRLLGAAADRDKLPHNLNAEASVLGGILISRDQSALLAQIDTLEPSDFFHEPHKIAFEAVRNLERRRQPVDVVTLENEIEKQGKLEAVGGVAFIGELAALVPTADNVVAYAEEVQAYARNRRTIDKLGGALAKALSWSSDERDELVAETIRDLQELDDLERRRRGQGLKYTTPIIEYLGEVEPDDDDAEEWTLRDLVPRNEPWLWGGPAKTGKTWTLLDLALALALGEDWLGFKNTLGRPARVMTVFREDGRRRLHKRLWELCRGRNVSLHHELLKENLRISREPLYLPDARDQKRLIDEAKAFKADVIAIDNLTRVMLGDSSDERDVKAFAVAWAAIGDATGAAVGFLHHVRKGGSERGGDPFDMFRGAGDILGFARHAVLVLPRRDEDEKTAEVRMRGNLDLRREGFVMGFDRRIRESKQWVATLHNRGDIEQKREALATLKKEKTVEIKRAALEDELEKRIQYAITVATRSGNVRMHEVATWFGKSAANSMKPAFDRAEKQGRLVKCTGTEKNLGYRLPGQTQKVFPT